MVKISIDLCLGAKATHLAVLSSVIYPRLIFSSQLTRFEEPSHGYQPGYVPFTPL